LNGTCKKAQCSGKCLAKTVGMAENPT